MSVYAARVGRYVKIGYAADPRKRIQRLRSDDTGRPVDFEYDRRVELMATCSGDKDTEFLIQRCLWRHKITGEWFADCPIVREVIEGWRDPDAAVMGQPKATCVDHASDVVWYGGRYDELAQANAIRYMEWRRDRLAKVRA